MIQSISLIQAIILLNEKEALKRPVGCQSRKIDYLEATAKNIAKAAELVEQILGRGLSRLSLQAKILHLLIEQMAEKQSAIRKIDRSDFRFTKINVQLETGWSDPQIKLHLNRLEDLHFVSYCDPLNHQYKLLYSSRRVSKFVIDSRGQRQRLATCAE